MSSSSSPSSYSDLPWYGNYYTPGTIPQLPRKCVLGSRGHVTVDYARPDDRSTCLDLIEESAREGRDNVGVDEYTGSMAGRLDVLMTPSLIFAVRDEETDAAEAFIVISPSVYARSFDSCLASIVVFRSKEIQSDYPVYGQLIRLALEFAQEADLGYTNAIASVAGCEHSMIRAFRQEGFLRIGAVPNGVNIAGYGPCESVLLLKTLKAEPRARRSREAVLQFCDRLFSRPETKQQYEECDLPTTDFLPLPYVFANGLKVVCRNMRKDEDSAVFDIWNAAASQGLGYGADEVPTLDAFRIAILLDHYAVIFEDTSTRKIVGLSLLTSSYYARTGDRKFGETSLFIAEEFRGLKLGHEAILIELALLKQLGFESSLNDMLASNLRMLSATRKHREDNAYEWLTVTVFPHGTYTEGYGWDDQVLRWCYLKNVPKFTELAAETLKRSTKQVENQSKV